MSKCQLIETQIAMRLSKEVHGQALGHYMTNDFDPTWLRLGWSPTGHGWAVFGFVGRLRLSDVVCVALGVRFEAMAFLGTSV